MNDPEVLATLDPAEVGELAESLGLVPVGSQLAADPDVWLEWLKREVEKVIAGWLRHDRARLGQALYRIDVEERLVEDVVRTAPVDEVAARVADLVIDRVLRRIANRRQIEQKLREG